MIPIEGDAVFRLLMTAVYAIAGCHRYSNHWMSRVEKKRRHSSNDAHPFDDLCPLILHYRGEEVDFDTTLAQDEDTGRWLC